MKKFRMFQTSPVSPTVTKEVQLRSNGRFTGEKIIAKFANPDYHKASMDDVVCPQGAYPNANWRGMDGSRKPSQNGNTYVGRQRSGRIKRNFGNEGKVARTQGNAASFANSSPARQEILSRKAPSISSGEDTFIGSAALIEMENRRREAMETKKFRLI